MHTLQMETGPRDITMRRRFDAPRELVFEAYSSCEHIEQWWGPRSWPVAHCRMDFRPGGTWHYCMKGPEGQEAWALPPAVGRLCIGLFGPQATRPNASFAVRANPTTSPRSASNW